MAANPEITQAASLAAEYNGLFPSVVHQPVPVDMRPGAVLRRVIQEPSVEARIKQLTALSQSVAGLREAHSVLGRRK